MGNGSQATVRVEATAKNGEEKHRGVSWLSATPVPARPCEGEEGDREAWWFVVDQELGKEEKSSGKRESQMMGKSFGDSGCEGLVGKGWTEEMGR